MSNQNMWSKNVIFKDGQLYLSSIAATELAKEFGTPTFFLDEEAFRTRALAWSEALTAEFGSQAGGVFYAAKSFISTAVAIKDFAA